MISIVIPTLNEELNISKTLKKLSLIKGFKKYEYIIVDDNTPPAPVGIFVTHSYLTIISGLW